MKKNKTAKEKKRNLVRITLILLLSLLVSFILCTREAKANNKILEQTVSDAFVFQSILLAHDLEPNSPNEYTDISTLENSNDTESFVSDAAIKTGISPYYIRVNYSANCVTIYTKDNDGNYTKPYKAMICSSGKSTPKSGTYKITYKYRWLSLYGGVYGQYSTRIVKNILFHSVPYYQQRADTLEYEEYDKLGTTASAGCIRLTVRDAKWIYDNITSGTYVEFYSDPSNPGPLGKPTAKKISDYKENRNWDPTDPDKNNPWNGGSGIPSITYTTETKKNNTNKNNTNIVNSNNNSTKSTTNTYTNNSTQSTSTQVVETTTINEPTTTPKQSNSNESSGTTTPNNNSTSDQKETEGSSSNSTDSSSSQSSEAENSSTSQGSENSTPSNSDPGTSSTTNTDTSVTENSET